MFFHHFCFPTSIFHIKTNIFSYICCPWLPLAAPGCPWLPLAAPGCPWLALAAPGCPWLPLAAPGCPWLSLAAPGCPWLPLAAPGCPWLPLAVPGCPWLPLAAPGCPWLPLAAPGCPWLPLAAPGCPWLPLAAPGCPWLPLAAPGCPWLSHLRQSTGVGPTDFALKPPHEQIHNSLSGGPFARIIKNIRSQRHSNYHGCVKSRVGTRSQTLVRSTRLLAACCAKVVPQRCLFENHENRTWYQNQTFQKSSVLGPSKNDPGERF